MNSFGATLAEKINARWDWKENVHLSLKMIIIITQMREQGQVLLPRVFPPEDKIRSRQPDLPAGQDARWQPTFYW